MEQNTPQEEQKNKLPSVLAEGKANYIVKVRRGGIVSHVWELEDTIIRFNNEMKGWEIFTDKNAAVFVSGDVEIWRIDEKPIKPVPPPPKKEPLKISFGKKKKVVPPPPLTTVREIYEKLYKKLDIRSRLFPDKNELEDNA